MTSKKKKDIAIPIVESTKGKISTTSYIKPASDAQRDFIKSIKKNTITIGYGSAGTGKSLLALHEGIKLVNNESSEINKIFYIRANVSISQEKDIGFLPGGLIEKIMPLAYPVLDNLIEFVEESTAKYIVESGKIEVLPVSMVRGRSFKNSYVIVDESQNCINTTFKTLLSRISQNSKMVLIGDVRQCDLDVKYSLNNGLLDAVHRLQNLDNVGIVEFGYKDIQRHPIIADVLARYE